MIDGVLQVCNIVAKAVLWEFTLVWCYCYWVDVGVVVNVGIVVSDGIVFALLLLV